MITLELYNVRHSRYPEMNEKFKGWFILHIWFGIALKRLMLWGMYFFNIIHKYITIRSVYLTYLKMTSATTHLHMSRSFVYVCVCVLVRLQGMLGLLYEQISFHSYALMFHKKTLLKVMLNWKGRYMTITKIR